MSDPWERGRCIVSACSMLSFNPLHLFPSLAQSSHRQGTNCSFLTLSCYFSTGLHSSFVTCLWILPVPALSLEPCPGKSSVAHPRFPQARYQETFLSLLFLHLFHMGSSCLLKDTEALESRGLSFLFLFCPMGKKKNPSLVSIQGIVVLLLNHWFSFELRAPNLLSACVYFPLCIDC